MNGKRSTKKNVKKSVRVRKDKIARDRFETAMLQFRGAL